MRHPRLALLALASASCLVFGTTRYAQADGPAEPAPSLVQSSANSSTAPTACIGPAKSFNGKTIAQWRAEGPEGLAELMEQMQPTIKLYMDTKRGPLHPKAEALQTRLDHAEANLRLVDAVAQQRDAYTSGLYWYTDLDDAKAQAQRTGRPILSLRMLGKLNEEYSCANSRFFRTVLYADETVSALLREQFVLHWQSVRPVPVITIDMGDGRTIKRTITGNSAHYILDPKGRVIDCLPGLYASGVFERYLDELHASTAVLAKMDDKMFVQAVQGRHAMQAGELDRAWGRYMAVLADEQRAAIQKPEGPKERLKMPDARTAGRVAFGGKGRIEMPLVNHILPKVSSPQQAADDMELWERIAEAYTEEARMDDTSRALMALKAPQESIGDAMRRAMAKSYVESPLVKMIRNFEGGIAIETARNEHLLRRQLHDWFVTAEAPLELDALNRRVYAQLFLTPEEDPWLGLVPADTYSALDGGGLIN